MDYVFVAVGGGGLIAGIAYYLKQCRRTAARIIGVQPTSNCCMYESVRKGRIDTETPLRPTLSEGTNGGIEAGSCTFELCRHLVDEWVLVSDAELERGMAQLGHTEKMIVEGSAALAYTGCLKYMSANQVFGWHTHYLR